MANFIVGITGASGSIYGVRLVDALTNMGHFVYVAVSDAGRLVMEQEIFLEKPVTSNQIPDKSFSGFSSLEIVDCHDMAHQIASGSNQIEAMIIVPCSMNTLAHIAQGTTANLIHRAAGVTIKEKRPLILVPRETPLSPIHLRNMLRLSKIGVHIVPAMPAFYTKPKTIDELVDFIAGRILDLLKLEHNLYKRWQPDLLGQNRRTLI